MATIIYTLLQLYRKPHKNRTLGITYEVLYIPADVRKRVQREANDARAAKANKRTKKKSRKSA